LETAADHGLTIETIHGGGSWDTPRLGHGFFGRTGGASHGRFFSLNLSRYVGDDPETVTINWQRARDAMPRFPRIATLNQVHGIDVHIIGDDYDGARPSGDGMVTATPGIALAIFTADCVPMLMVDADAKVAGAFHAGWRGTLAGIARAGVRRMTEAGADIRRIEVVLGPSIGRCCYEVDAELGRRFTEAWPCAGSQIGLDRGGKTMLDLRGILTDQLKEAGVSPESIAQVGPCTRCASELFFSRRAAGGQTCGLQLSFIGFIDGAAG
jgi:YfiH family protein